MKQAAIPAQLDPYRFARLNRVVQGEMAVSQLAGLQNSLRSYEQTVALNAQFILDEDNLCVIRGTLDVTLSLTCERCLKALDHPLHTEFNLSPVRDDVQANKLPDQYEAIQLNDAGELSMIQLVTEEILLNLPLVSVHAPDASECEITSLDLNKELEPVEPDALATVPPHPFAGLKTLMSD